MKHFILVLLFVATALQSEAWGFFGHRLINRIAVFLLPPEMLLFYKPHIGFIEEHAIDPDKRRYAITEEGPRHYIDIDRYGRHARDSLPRSWNKAIEKYGEDTLQLHGIVPWWIQTMLYRLTEAFRQGDALRILRLSAELGHYIADAHVPLHASSNHNGQHTGQRGIHGFWESRVPELLYTQWDFFIGRAVYLDHPGNFIWDRVWESAAAADSVLLQEKLLTQKFSPSRKFAYEERNGTVLRQYSAEFTRAYDRLLMGMVERRMKQSVMAVASFWFTAWVNAGQPELGGLVNRIDTESDRATIEELNNAWRTNRIKGREHDDH